MAREQLRGRDWLSFSLAAALPGFVLAMALAGVFQYLGDPIAQDKSQVTMWIVPPLWMAAAGTAFWFRSPRAAWGWLLLAAALASAAVFALRTWG
ncbi:hypothetical protein [Lysobacter sp. F60174L2]|uniref:hypothetical protein n=1 Tax=Lysobacter sp. F60174L2 TaxID=3459295 RepID=UPI00403D989A